MIPFAGEFHARSAFSFLRGASQPEVMIQRAIAMGYETIAITDDLGFYGSARAHKAAEDTDLKVVVGASLEISPGCFIPVLCASQKGYQLLSGHLTDRHLKDRDPESFRSETGLIALTGDREGPVCRPLLRNDRAGALAAVESLMQIFGRENLYIELNRHGLRDDGLLNRQLIDLAKHFRLPLLACNAPIQSVRADRSLADAFTCLRHHVSLDQAGKLLAINGERHLKSAAEMSRLFADLPEALLNTHRLKDRIGYSLENLGYRFPDFPDEQGKPLSMVEQTKLLRELSIAGAKRLRSWDAKFEAQIEKEIALIHQLGFSGYFLIVHEIVWFARDRDIFCQGRGSAANSAVCYALGITRFDPVKNHLLFERFLSANSKSWPDIDIDFPSGEKRELVIQHVFQKYGARGAAMTANVITYRPRSAFREMSKVLSFPPSLADRFSSQGHGFHGDEKEEDEKPEESAFEALVGNLIPPSHPRIKALGHLYESVLGMPRHLGQHSGGMIICDRGLDGVVPIQPATMANRTVVQWDKDDCEDLGIVKIDLLGLGILAAMENMLEIRSRRCPEKSLDLSTLPLTDPQVFELMTKADTIGTFQVESRAQMATLPIMRPKEFYDVAIEVAIIRPGPIVGDLMHPYLNRRRGRETPDYIVAKESEFYPEFRRILGRTLGVPMFQEQMLQMAMKIADFDGGEADQLRRAISFKRSDERMIKVTAKLRARMTAKDVPEDVQEKIIHSIGSFALYGFPESHALSFGWLAYISCWFKVNHPAEFYTGLINHQPMGFYSVHTLIQDAKHHSIRVLPVSCVHSGNFTDVEDDRTIRLGLHRLKGLRPSVRERLIFERQRRPFESLEDFLIRVRPNEKERRIFAESGALNDLPEGLHRRQALWQAELPLHGDLLDHQQGDEIQLTPMSISERLSSDVATQGASTGPHPMKLWREKSHLIVQRARDLPILPAKTPVTVAGLVICRQRPGTAKGHCFISLEDETGIANLFVKRETFEANRMLISSESFLTASGYVQISEGDQPTVFVTHLAPLSGLDPSHASESHDFH